MTQEVTFQAVAWSTREDETSLTIDIFGRTEDGRSVHVETPFEPYFFAKLPLGKSPPRLNTLVEVPTLIKRRDLWGFQNQTEHTFAKLTFKTLSDMRRGEWACRNQKYQVYEANLDPVLRLMHRTDIQSTGWLIAKGRPGNASSCTVDLVVGDWRTLKPVSRDDIAPLRVASLDIECYSKSGAFPSAFEKADVCFQIAVTTRVNSVPYDRKVFCVKETTCADSESFLTERAMLERFAEYIRDELDPDIITGWNIFGFDLEYMYTRSVVCGCPPDAFVWGRLHDVSVELVTKNLSSSALGSNTLKMVPMIGRYVFDMFQDVKREHKLESYSLNNVSKVFLGDQKIDMPVREIFKRFHDGDPVKLGEVAEYCLKDTELPHQIAEHLCMLPNLLEMAKATWVPLSYLSERGQQIKVFSQVCRKARLLGFMVPTMRVDRNAPPEDQYQGATVLDAQTGAYYGPVTALDFASLYPSIMRAHNLCYSTLVMEKRYLDLPGVTYETYGPHVFVQGVPSLLPEILNELAAFRKKAKRDMASAEGTPLEAVYNGRQLAYKISMNSVYGFTGASKGMLPLLAIASTVTFRGRQMIDETKTYVEEHFPGAKVRYGDSVMPWTPVLVKSWWNEEISSRTIESLCTNWFPYEHFKSGQAEQSEDMIFDAMTHLGWKPIRRVVRHKSLKKIYRVTSPYGMVDVTEDHSLLDNKLNILKPHELHKNTILLHYGPDIPGENTVTLLHEAWDGYVYDIETEAGTFQAGVGQIIVKNTDSVMVEFDVQGRKGQDAIDYSWAQGELAAEACTKLFRAPNDLELEKVYCPYFLYSKKRYAAKMYEKKGDKVVFKKIDVKGLQVVRRDTCGYVRGVLKHLLNLVLESNDPRPPIEFARQSGRDLLAGKISSSDLLMSKQLGSDYKTRQPHVEVRDKIRKRAPGSEPQNGDRVQFLIVKGSGRLLCEKAEDPSFVTENKIPVDYAYYFDHQLQKPVCDLLEPLVGAKAFETIFKSVDYLTTRSITSYFKVPDSRASPCHP
jgi:DNA polymerase delta subunit 1